MLSPFVQKLRHGARFTDIDIQSLKEIAQPIYHLGARQDILCEGQKPYFVPLIVQGWACRYRILDDGRRQITSLFLPGDLCEPFGTLPRLLDHSFSSITPVVVAQLKPETLRKAARESAAIEEALWWDLLVASGIQREHTVSLGQRTGIQRLGHLLCELHLRLQVVGLADGSTFDLPLTQIELGDLLGLTSVHINRTLRDLKAMGLVVTAGRRVTIPDLPALRAASFFDPAYLNLDETHLR